MNRCYWCEYSASGRRAVLDGCIVCRKVGLKVFKKHVHAFQVNGNNNVGRAVVYCRRCGKSAFLPK